MPNIKSAKKRVKVTKVKHDCNQSAKTALKTAVKNFETVLSSDDNQLKARELSSVIKAIDKASARGLLHKNTASRKKSALMLKYNAAVANA